MYGEVERADAHLQFVPAMRPVFEAALLREFLERGKPVLGICYGCQFANVWRGGSLIQDIPTQLRDTIEHGDSRHAVHVAPGTVLHDTLCLDECDIRSSHHQAIARTAPDARVTAVAPDGVIEAIEFSGVPFFVGVQWHPECDRESLATQRLFAAFVQSAGG
jgi:putative glutamine amidotransferase